MEKPMDPRNDPSYDTYDYGTEPIPGDTTWAKQKEDKTKAKCPSCSCQKQWKKGAEGPLFNDEIPSVPKGWLPYKREEACLPYHCSLMVPKEKGELTPSSFLQLSDTAFSWAALKGEWMPYRPTMMNARLILAEEPIHSAASTLTDPLARVEPKP
jgi:hypothetical protein